MTDRTVLILADNVGGHRLYYVRLLLEAAVRSGRSAQVLLPSTSQDSSEVRTHLGTDLRRLCIFEQDRDLRLTAERHLSGGGAVLVPEADRHLLWLVSRRFRTWRFSVTALVMRSAPTSGGFRARAVHAVKWLAVKGLRLTGCRVFALRAPFDPPATRWQVTDPTPISQPEAPHATNSRDALGLPRGPIIFSILGALAARKGVLQAVEGWTRTDPALRRGGRLLLAGKIEPEVEARLLTAVASAEEAAQGSVVLHNEYVDDRRLERLVMASDVIICTYANPGPSGLFIRAVAAGKPVIAVAGSDVGKVVQKHRAGSLLAALEPTAFSMAFTTILSEGVPTAWTDSVLRLRGSLASEEDFSSALLGIDRP